MLLCKLVESRDYCVFLRLFPGFEAEGRELRESTAIPSRVEPLEEAPQEAQCEIFCKSTNLFPVEEMK